MKKLKLNYNENVNGGLLGGALGGLIISFPIYTALEGPWYWVNTTIWKMLIFALVGKYLISLVQFLLAEEKPKLKLKLDIHLIALALGASGILRYGMEPVWRVALICVPIVIVGFINREVVKGKFKQKKNK